MMTRYARFSGIVCVPLAIMICATVWNGRAEGLQARAEQPRNARLKELLNERLAALKQVAKLITDAYDAEAVSLVQVITAEQAALRAELDLCETETERIVVLEKIVQLSMKLEKQLAEAVQARGAPLADSLNAKASRLEAEIALARVTGK